MDRDLDKGKKKEAMDLIMMEEDQIKKIMKKLERRAAVDLTSIR
jgi:hypothetical protein